MYDTHLLAESQLAVNRQQTPVGMALNRVKSTNQQPPQATEKPFVTRCYERLCFSEAEGDRTLNHRIDRWVGGFS